jgi:hypothetical protein
MEVTLTRIHIHVNGIIINRIDGRHLMAWRAGLCPLGGVSPPGRPAHGPPVQDVPMPEREILRGGVGNAGLVWREGDRVSRPAGPQAPTVHALLRHVREAGFDGVPEPLGIDDGRELLTFLPGDVPCPPFSAWSVSDDALASVATLLRRFHDATRGFAAPGCGSWNREMAEPRSGGDVVCHNDVCLENVVFRDGVAVALLDLDFAAPGSRWWDVASFARMCVPMDDPEDAARRGMRSEDAAARLRIVADAYGLPADRSPLVDRLQEQTDAGGRFVKRRVDAGDEAFTRMWNESGGAARYDRRRAWFASMRPRLIDALHGR